MDLGFNESLQKGLNPVITPAQGQSCQLHIPTGNRVLK